jgi:hypothetical protein
MNQKIEVIKSNVIPLVFLRWKPFLNINHKILLYMANYILKNNIVILRCSNWVMDLMYNNLRESLNHKKLEDNQPLINFVNALNQEDYGRGCIYVDINNFFDANSSNGSLFREILEHAINKIENDASIDLNVIDLLQTFKNNI